MISIKKDPSFWYSYWRRIKHVPKLLTESFFSIDSLNLLDRGGKDRKRYVLNIGEAINHDLVIGEHAIYILDRKNQNLTAKIDILNTYSHVGNQRSWFSCPNNKCHRRVRKLYYAVHSFYCRHCLCLGYRSQREDVFLRLRRRQSKIESFLLDRGGSFGQKPKRMHTRTFNNLSKQWWKYEIKGESLS